MNRVVMYVRIIVDTVHREEVKNGAQRLKCGVNFLKILGLRAACKLYLTVVNINCTRRMV